MFPVACSKYLKDVQTVLDLEDLEEILEEGEVVPMSQWISSYAVWSCYISPIELIKPRTKQTPTCAGGELSSDEDKYLKFNFAWPQCDFDWRLGTHILEDLDTSKAGMVAAVMSSLHTVALTPKGIDPIVNSLIVQQVVQPSIEFWHV